ncbi:MAG: type II toxin-antitoxin system YafQ family toxin [bacterium]
MAIQLEPVASTRFDRDVRRMAKRGKPLKLLWDVVDALCKGQPMPPNARPHPLTGTWVGCFECHLQPDWLLIWRVQGSLLLLARTGTHADLYD